MAGGRNATNRLIAELDGGPHDDPREAEERELLDDGQDEEDAKKPKDDEDSKDVSFEEWADEDEKKPKKAAPKEPVEEEEPAEEEEAKLEEKGEEAEEKELEEKTVELDEDGKVKVSEGEEVKDDPKTKFKTVPYPRFRKELAKRWGLAETVARLSAELETLKSASQKQTSIQEKSADPEPNSQLDPLAHVQWQNRQLAAEIKAMRTGGSQQQDVIPATELAALKDVYVESAQELMAEKADFADAYKHAEALANQWINANYPQANKGQKAAIFEQMEMRAVRNALRAGQDPAEMVYNYAVQNGFKPSGAATTPKQAKANSDVKERILDAATEAARKNRAKSVAGSGGTANRRPLTEADIDGMSNAELERFMRLNSGQSDPLKA